MDKIKKHRSHISARRAKQRGWTRRLPRWMRQLVKRCCVREASPLDKNEKMTRETEEQKPKATECMGCGIMVGGDYMETQLYQVGDYKICGWCLEHLKKRGSLWVQPYNSYRWLYPDGQVVVKKSVLGEDEEE